MPKQLEKNLVNGEKNTLFVLPPRDLKIDIECKCSIVNKLSLQINNCVDVKRNTAILSGS